MRAKKLKKLNVLDFYAILHEPKMHQTFSSPDDILSRYNQATRLARSYIRLENLIAPYF